MLETTNVLKIIKKKVMARKKTKVNEQALKGWISPSREILKPKITPKDGKPIMSEEEFDKIWYGN